MSTTAIDSGCFSTVQHSNFSQFNIIPVSNWLWSTTATWLLMCTKGVKTLIIFGFPASFSLRKVAGVHLSNCIFLLYWSAKPNKRPTRLRAFLRGSLEDLLVCIPLLLHFLRWFMQLVTNHIRMSWLFRWSNEQIFRIVLDSMHCPRFWLGALCRKMSSLAARVTLGSYHRWVILKLRSRLHWRIIPWRCHFVRTLLIDRRILLYTGRTNDILHSGVFPRSGVNRSQRYTNLRFPSSTPETSSYIIEYLRDWPALILLCSRWSNYALFHADFAKLPNLCHLAWPKFCKLILRNPSLHEHRPVVYASILSWIFLSNWYARPIARFNNSLKT